MIVSHGRKYIFIHIPKTGGTSMALALEGRAMKDDLMLGDTPKAVRRRRKLAGVKSAGRLWKHSTLSDIDGLVTQQQVQEYFTFTLVRNPWDRMVSYYHWLRGQNFDHPAVVKAKALNFSAFLHDPVIGQSIRQNDYASYMVGPGGIERCNLFIRVEDFDSDATPLWEHLGFALWLGRENASERDRDYRRYYTENDSMKLAELCANDIARFGYSFD